MSEFGKTVLVAMFVVAVIVAIGLGSRQAIRREYEESQRICNAYFALSHTAADSLRAASRSVNGRPCAYFLEP